MINRLILTQKINKNKEIIPVDYIEKREDKFYLVTKGEEKEVLASSLSKILKMYG